MIRNLKYINILCLSSSLKRCDKNEKRNSLTQIQYFTFVIIINNTNEINYMYIYNFIYLFCHRLKLKSYIN